MIDDLFLITAERLVTEGRCQYVPHVRHRAPRYWREPTEPAGRSSGRLPRDLPEIDRLFRDRLGAAELGFVDLAEIHRITG